MTENNNTDDDREVTPQADRKPDTAQPWADPEPTVYYGRTGETMSVTEAKREARARVGERLPPEIQPDSTPPLEDPGKVTDPLIGETVSIPEGRRRAKLRADTDLNLPVNEDPEFPDGMPSPDSIWIGTGQVDPTRTHITVPAQLESLEIAIPGEEVYWAYDRHETIACLSSDYKRLVRSNRFALVDTATVSQHRRVPIPRTLIEDYEVISIERTVFFLTVSIDELSDICWVPTIAHAVETSFGKVYIDLE